MKLLEDEGGVGTVCLQYKIRSHKQFWKVRGIAFIVLRVAFLDMRKLLIRKNDLIC